MLIYNQHLKTLRRSPVFPCTLFHSEGAFDENFKKDEENKCILFCLRTSVFVRCKRIRDDAGDADGGTV